MSSLGRQAGRLHVGGLTVVATLVIALHALVLGAAEDWAMPLPVRGDATVRSVQVSLAPEPAARPMIDPLPAAESRPVAPIVTPQSPRRQRTKAAPRPAPAAVASASAVIAPAPEVEAPAADASSPLAPEASASDAASPAPILLAAAETKALAPAPAASAAEPMPVYPTNIPTAFTFAYDLSRSPLRGNGNLVLRMTDTGYEARLEGSVAGFSVLQWISVGGFDDAGFAPLRFTEQRLRRAAQAANFQRTAGKISYSASSDEIALPPGAQDRLSWMLQLAAIAHARPAKLTAGQRITMFVTGVRADAEPWSFSVIGPETVRTPLGSIETIHLQREPRFAHDTRADVWLDPSRHHLPARARLSNSEDGSDAFELELREAPASMP